MCAWRVSLSLWWLVGRQWRLTGSLLWHARALRLEAVAHQRLGRVAQELVLGILRVVDAADLWRIVDITHCAERARTHMTGGGRGGEY